jgi:Uma2 family endonuclease
MATATLQRKMTAEEFYRWANRPENEHAHWELAEGQVIEMPPPGEAHALVCWFVSQILSDYIREHGSGHLLTNDCGLIVARNPDTVRGPDIMLSLENLTLENARPGHSDRVPTLVVEVFSPNDRPGNMARRVEQFQRYGVPLVWVIYPEERTVNVFRLDELPRVLDEADELAGNGVLPAFSCKVSDLFALPTKPSKPARRTRKGHRE